ncbi:MAG: TetR/AcrR family transcriptional regulator [Pseudolysinimonas sp.]
MSDPDLAIADGFAIEPGLRERKRLATRRAILMAAITVVRERGLEAATVDEIARIADVSPRTFFNYFSSKEEAIVGDGPELPGEEAQEAFVRDRSPILPAIAALFATVITPALHDQEIILARRAITKEYPEIGGRRWASIHRFEGQLTELVARRLADEDPALAADPRALTSRARLIAFITISAMRHAWLDWMDDPGERRGLLEHLDDSIRMLPEVLRPSGPR